MQQAQLLKMHGSKMIQDVLMPGGNLTKALDSDCLSMALIIQFYFPSFSFLNVSPSYH